MSSATSQLPVIVTGDVFLDHLLYLGHDRRIDSSLDLGTEIRELAGGAALTADLLQAFLADRQIDVIGPSEEARRDCPKAFGLFDWFPTDGKVAKDKKVWRVRNVLGYETAKENYTPPALAAGDGPCGVAVLDDAGQLFRRITSRFAWPEVIRDSAAAPPNWIVLKSQSPLAAGDLWHHLMSDRRNLTGRCVVVLPCSHLRSEEVRVIPGLSWERTAMDLAGEFNRNPALHALRKCRYVIVRFDNEGALLADFTNPGKPEFRLVFDPANLEGDWAKHAEGTVYGYHTTFAAAIAATLALIPADVHDIRPHLERAITSGLAVTRRLLTEGHGPSTQTPAFPFKALALEFAEPSSNFSTVTVKTDNPCWSIATSDASGGSRIAPLFGLARRVALNGTVALHGLPFQKFGKLFIVDRGEIENLRGLHRIVADYAQPGPADKPLSIAVFGAPGSGKSFGVKELARAILGDKVPILEFNLSQFDDAKELLGLFHQVRDKALEGHTPLVFWDEFDSKDLKWLQYLLAPMQDGRFQDGQISHPIGKCIFVFAGGTSHDFQGFGPQSASPNESKEKQDAWQAFKNKKGPDFKSRLNGYLNVLGPNPVQIATGDDPADVAFPIRRALLLRAKLGLFGNERLTIDRGMLSAFLEIGRYAHGARSMEKIVEQTRAAAGHHARIGRSHLPPRQVLELHVDADEFLQIVERDLAFQFEVEPMAEAYHEFYRELAQREGWKPTYDMRYRDLPEHIKDDNREAARRISDVVGLIGLYVVRIGQAPAGTSEADAQAAMDQNLELLAEAEHDGWMESRLRNGWRYGPERDDDRRISPKLIPYARLGESDKNKDRNAVRNYGKIVAKANYQVVTGPPPRKPKK